MARAGCTCCGVPLPKDEVGTCRFCRARQGVGDQRDATDMVSHPPHYTAHPSGVECIDVVEHMGFCLGNAVKYIWRAGQKGDAIEDLRKARWYIEREIARLEGQG